MNGFESLRGVRLGARERTTLIAAPSRPLLTDERKAERRERIEAVLLGLARVGPSRDAAVMHERRKAVDSLLERLKEHDDDEVDTDELLALDAPAKAERAAILRAARRLHDLGLVEYWTGWRARTAGPRQTVLVCRTELGDRVVEHYKPELESGRRIRWMCQRAAR